VETRVESLGDKKESLGLHSEQGNKVRGVEPSSLVYLLLLLMFVVWNISNEISVVCILLCVFLYGLWFQFWHCTPLFSCVMKIVICFM